MKPSSKLLLTAVLASLAATASAKSITTTVHDTADHDRVLGHVRFTDTPRGLQIEPHLSGLKPGPHGFHIHHYPRCGNHGKDAGGHLDPHETGKHLGPYNPKGHLGDLPVLHVRANGKATHRMVAPRLKVKDIQGHSIIVHEHGDNGRDDPKPLGGGGARVACGVISD